MRPRTKINTSLVGSSDMRRVRAKNAILEANHREFVGSELHTALMAVKLPAKKEPAPETLVQVKCCDKWVVVEYRVVKAAKYNNYKMI